MKRALFLCNNSMIMPAPWLEAGYECTLVDVLHPRGEHVSMDGRLIKIGVDVRQYAPSGRFDFAFAFPPCTHLAGSGAWKWAEKGQTAVDDAMELVSACWGAMVKSSDVFALENPVGRLTKLWRKWDYRFDPCDFGGYLDPPGDARLKATCIWASDRFVMPPQRRVPPTDKKWILAMSPGPERQIARSMTPAGFARAVFLANADLTSSENGEPD